MMSLSEDGTYSLTAGFPAILTPLARGAEAIERALASKQRIEAELLRSGAVLLRGWSVTGVPAFRSFAAGFGHELLDYEFGSTPRTELTKGVYTSTEYPAHQAIPLHNEQSYSRTWPMKIWFHCHTVAPKGGETPIADSRAVYRTLDPAIVRRFEDRRLCYVRNYGNGLDLPWQRVFGTAQRSVVESFCAEQGIHCEWKADGELRTSQVCQASARHPRTQERVWFNQAHLFHVSNLEAEAREALLEVVDVADLPRNVYYGDGGEIETSILDAIRGAWLANQVSFPWLQGDVLMLDNMLTAHARSPFEGPRRVVVAMAEPHSASE
jgi:alpha-ketoglutarate-dependent taurine dioxygenase